jgi:hypothetical protein
MTKHNNYIQCTTWRLYYRCTLQYGIDCFIGIVSEWFSGESFSQISILSACAAVIFLLLLLLCLLFFFFLFCFYSCSFVSTVRRQGHLGHFRDCSEHPLSDFPIPFYFPAYNMRLAKDWTVRVSNPGGARFSAPVKTGPASYLVGTGSFRRVKRLGRYVDHPPPCSAEVKGRVELYLYSPSGPSWSVLGWNLPLTLPCNNMTCCEVLFHPIKVLFSLKFVSLNVAYNVNFSQSPLTAPLVLA